MRELLTAASRIHSLEQLAERKSALHRLHPLVKILFTILYLAAVVSFPSGEIVGLMPFFFYATVWMAVSDTPYRPLLRRLAAALPFSLFGGVSNIVFNRTVAFMLGGIPITFGMLSCFSILIKTALAVMAVLILMATTTMNDLCDQLVRMKTPAVLVLVLALVYRYVSVLLDEARGMYVCCLIRSPGRRAVRMRDMGGLLGTLLLRSFDRAERVYAAMKCRGFHGASYPAARRRLTPGDCLLGLAVGGAIVLFRLVSLSRWLGGLVA